MKSLPKESYFIVTVETRSHYQNVEKNHFEENEKEKRFHNSFIKRFAK